MESRCILPKLHAVNNNGALATLVSNGNSKDANPNDASIAGLVCWHIRALLPARHMKSCATLALPGCTCADTA